MRKGIKYEEFKSYAGKYPDCLIVEMDIVERIKGGKAFRFRYIKY